MDAKTILGRFVRKLREEASLTQEQLAQRAGITYQYLSGLENGRENFSIDILDALGKALECPLPHLISGAFAEESMAPIPTVNKDYFRRQVPLPPKLPALPSLSPELFQSNDEALRSRTLSRPAS